METEDFYKDIAKEVDTRFDQVDISKNENRQLPVGKGKATGMMK